MLLHCVGSGDGPGADAVVAVPARKDSRWMTTGR